MNTAAADFLPALILDEEPHFAIGSCSIGFYAVFVFFSIILVRSEPFFLQTADRPVFDELEQAAIDIFLELALFGKEKTVILMVEHLPHQLHFALAIIVRIIEQRRLIVDNCVQLAQFQFAEKILEWSEGEGAGQMLLVQIFLTGAALDHSDPLAGEILWAVDVAFQFMKSDVGGEAGDENTKKRQRDDNDQNRQHPPGFAFRDVVAVANRACGDHRPVDALEDSWEIIAVEGVVVAPFHQPDNMGGKDQKQHERSKFEQPVGRAERREKRADRIIIFRLGQDAQSGMKVGIAEIVYFFPALGDGDRADGNIELPVFHIFQGAGYAVAWQVAVVDIEIGTNRFPQVD